MNIITFNDVFSQKGYVFYFFILELRIERTGILSLWRKSREKFRVIEKATVKMVAQKKIRSFK